MDPQPPLKKFKAEQTSEDGDESGDEDEALEALEALIQHRAAEVQSLKQKVAFYRSQLEDAEKRLAEAQSRKRVTRQRRFARDGMLNGVAEEARSPILVHGSDSNASRPQLVIPALNPPTAVDARRPFKTDKPPTNAVVLCDSDSSRSGASTLEVQQKAKRTKRKIEQRDHRELIPSIRSRSSRCLVKFQPGTHISSRHKRKLRSLEVCPANDLLFVTSALDGVVNLWEVQGKGHSASLLSTTDCLSPKQRRWPEDLTWHPDGDSLFASYSADGGDSQISVLNLNSTGEKRVVFLEQKPHLKGNINNIIFMPWSDVCFATGGSDHAVILWQEKEDNWKPKTLHRNQHSSAVMGVAGLQQKKILLSAGTDKRIVGFDLLAGRSDFKYHIEDKCLSALPNPSDFNLFMVQTAAPGKQLRLFDIRLRQTEIHAFGWKQESSESQSALINQSWSPDGWYISSGSADPMIHIFDIRYNNGGPSQSVQAHQKRVFKAVWHQSVALLTSISSDLNIGLHKIA